MRKIGFDASFYCYVRAPKGSRGGESFKNAEDAASYLVKEALISTVPWDDAGPYLRLAVTFGARNWEEEREVIAEMERRFLQLGLWFD